MLVDADTGMPPSYPMLFITTQFRNAGQLVPTMEAALGAIQVLLDFTEARGMDLEERVLKREFLATHEIDALCDVAQHRRKRHRQDPPTVSAEYHDKRLTYIAKYLEWFVHEVLDGIQSRSVQYWHLPELSNSRYEIASRKSVSASTSSHRQEPAHRTLAGASPRRGVLIGPNSRHRGRRLRRTG